jgi:hypothetical protein
MQSLIDLLEVAPAYDIYFDEYDIIFILSHETAEALTKILRTHKVDYRHESNGTDADKVRVIDNLEQIKEACSEVKVNPDYFIEAFPEFDGAVDYSIHFRDKVDIFLRYDKVHMSNTQGSEVMEVLLQNFEFKQSIFTYMLDGGLEAFKQIAQFIDQHIDKSLIIRYHDEGIITKYVNLDSL